MIPADLPFADIQRVKVGKYCLDVRRGGVRGADTILLVHGIGVSSRYFLPLAKELAQWFDVIVVDLPGYGTTPKPARALTLPQLADVLAGYLAQSQSGPVVAVGHSMGCQIVAHLARRHSELCEKLILLGPTVNKAERTRFLQAARLCQDVLREPWWVSRVIVRDYLRMGFRRYLQTSRFMITDQIEKTLRGLELPILIVRGQKDKIVPREWVQYLATLLPGAEVSEVRGAPHVVQVKKVRELALIFRKFIAKHA